MVGVRCGDNTATASPQSRRGLLDEWPDRRLSGAFELHRTARQDRMPGEG